MAERITEADLQRRPNPEDAAVIAAALGRRIQRVEAWDAEGAAKVLLPHVAATIDSEQLLVAELRRLRGLIVAGLEPALSLEEFSRLRPIDQANEAVTEPAIAALRAEAGAIRDEGAPARTPAPRHVCSPRFGDPNDPEFIEGIEATPRFHANQMGGGPKRVNRVWVDGVLFVPAEKPDGGE